MKAALLFCLALVMNDALPTFSARAADFSSLQVVALPSKTQLHVKEAFKAVLRVENPMPTNQTVRVMSCSWDDHWKSSNTNVSWLAWDCPKNFAVNVDIPPGGAYTNQLEMLVLETAREGAVVFRMGFTPIDCTTTFWGDEVKLTVLPPVTQRPEHSDRLLLGTWRESGSTNTIEFQPQVALLAPILKIGYSVHISELVFEKPASVVIEKLDMQVDTNRTIVKELRTHNEPPYTNWSVPFRVTQDDLEITWEGKPTRYIRVSK